MSVPGVSLISAPTDKFQCEKRRDRDYYQFRQQNKKLVFRYDFTIVLILVYDWYEKINKPSLFSSVISGFSLFHINGQHEL